MVTTWWRPLVKTFQTTDSGRSSLAGSTNCYCEIENSPGQEVGSGQPGECRQTSVRKSEYCCCCLLCGEFWDSECWITRLNVQLRAGNKLSCFCAHLTVGCLWDGDNITSLWDEFCLLPPRYDRHLLTPGNITSEDQGLFCLIINTAGEEGPGTEAVYHGFIAFQLALRCRGSAGPATA